MRSTPGVGTEFRFYLCFAVVQADKESQNEECVQRTKQDLKEDKPLRGYHILLAEDNEINMEIAQFYLEEAGAKVEKAWNGQEAVDLFSQKPAGSFDAILMDVMMPVMNGIDAAKTIRSLNRPDAKTLPIIAMTANAFYEDAQKCLAAGMNAHLAKPLQIKKVKQTIAEWVKNNRTAKKDA